MRPERKRSERPDGSEPDLRNLARGPPARVRTDRRNDHGQTSDQQQEMGGERK